MCLTLTCYLLGERLCEGQIHWKGWFNRSDCWDYCWRMCEYQDVMECRHTLSYRLYLGVTNVSSLHCILWEAGKTSSMTVTSWRVEVDLIQPTQCSISLPHWIIVLHWEVCGSSGTLSHVEVHVSWPLQVYLQNGTIWRASVTCRAVSGAEFTALRCTGTLVCDGTLWKGKLAKLMHLEHIDSMSHIANVSIYALHITQTMKESFFF